MTKQEVKNRIEQLKKIVDKNRYAYHVLDKPIVSDDVNDSLKHELQMLENKYPDLITLDSPTQRVGGKPLEKFQKVTHETPMLSLTDAFNIDEVKDWEERNRKIDPACAENGYFAELKIDGLAVSLIYEKGIFVRGATRGDGKVGEDVTQNLKTIEAIPLKIPDIKNQKSIIEIRGEVYMPIDVLEKLNKKYQKENKSLLANPRNAAAGSIRQLDPKIAAERKLSFIAWDLLDHFGNEMGAIKTHKDAHKILADLGFKTLKENRFCKDLSEIEKFKKEMEKKREKLPFAIDGTVILIQDNKMREKLGVVGKAPRGMVAYKFAPEEATTIIEEITVQVGRTGTLTPVAIFKPTLVSGSTVSRATLHNEDEIRKKDIRVGDTVIIHKAGDIIPEVAKVIKELRPKNSQEFRFPKTCPVCGGKVSRQNGFAAYKCLNKKCFTIERRAIEHFVSRPAFDMAGLGPRIIGKFIEVGLIKDAADLFNLKTGDIEPLERFAEKSAQNIVASIQNHKEIELPRFIYALGIPNVGEETAYDIADIIKFEIRNSKSETMLKILKSKKIEDWQKIADIGPIVAKSIFDYFQNKQNQDFIERLFKSGVVITKQPLSTASRKLEGQTFVFTGGLDTITRDEARTKVRNLGGDISESVSRETGFLVVGSDPGEKFTRAQKLGVKIINEQQFLDLIK